MLPKDVTNLIVDYNETGIFVIIDFKIYWFNGKRLEFWIIKPIASDILTYENNLYIKQCGELFIYTNKIWHNIEAPLMWNHPLYLFNDKYWSQVSLNGKVYRQTYSYRFEMFDGKQTTILERNGYRSQLLAFNDDIYLFHGAISRKFNTITMQWSTLYNKIYLFNEKFYCFPSTKTYNTYDPKNDIWHFCNLC